MSVVELITVNISRFGGSYFDVKKKHREKVENTGKTQEFYLDWSVATLNKTSGRTLIEINENRQSRPSMGL